jgi:hypothetical protein
MEVAAIGAAASFSLADVSYDEAKLKEGSQCSCMGMMTLLLAAAAGTCQVRFHSNDDKELLITIGSIIPIIWLSFLDQNVFSQLHYCYTTTVTFAVLSMVIEGSSIVTVAGIISIAVTPIVLVQRFQLSRMSSKSC